MYFLVEEGNDAVFYNSYRSACTVLTSEVDNEAVKMLEKAQLERSAKKTTSGFPGATKEE